MTWPPTRPIRQRLFGALFLAVWVGGMYLCWGWRSEGEWKPQSALPRHPVTASDLAAMIEAIRIRPDPHGLYLEPTGDRVVLGSSVSIDESRVDAFGFTGWLLSERSRSGVPWNWTIDPALDRAWIVPRGLTVALIMTAVSSLILYVGWRAAVSGLPGPRGVCDGCGYDLRALSAARCPECGEAPGA